MQARITLFDAAYKDDEKNEHPINQNLVAKFVRIFPLSAIIYIVDIMPRLSISLDKDAIC